MQTDFQDGPILKAMQILTNMKCQFVVITPDGRKFGEIKDKTKKRKQLFPRGTFINYFGATLSKCQAGQTVEILVGEFNPETLRARICAYATNKWGNDTYSTKIVGNKIQVLRYL